MSGKDYKSWQATILVLLLAIGPAADAARVLFGASLTTAHAEAAVRNAGGSLQVRGPDGQVSITAGGAGVSGRVTTSGTATAGGVAAIPASGSAGSTGATVGITVRPRRSQRLRPCSPAGRICTGAAGVGVVTPLRTSGSIAATGSGTTGFTPQVDVTASGTGSTKVQAVEGSVGVRGGTITPTGSRQMGINIPIPGAQGRVTGAVVDRNGLQVGVNTPLVGHTIGVGVDRQVGGAGHDRINGAKVSNNVNALGGLDVVDHSVTVGITRGANGRGDGIKVGNDVAVLGIPVGHAVTAGHTRDPNNGIINGVRVGHDLSVAGVDVDAEVRAGLASGEDGKLVDGAIVGVGAEVAGLPVKHALRAGLDRDHHGNVNGLEVENSVNVAGLEVGHDVRAGVMRGPKGQVDGVGVGVGANVGPLGIAHKVQVGTTRNPVTGHVDGVKAANSIKVAGIKLGHSLEVGAGGIRPGITLGLGNIGIKLGGDRLIGLTASADDEKLQQG